MAEASDVGDIARRRFLAFRVEDQLYALPAESVTEVIRTPPVARVPQAPPALLGLANLRGTVLPIATARRLLGRPERAPRDTDRTIILSGGVSTGLAVDRIEGLMTVDADRLDVDQARLAAREGEQLQGAFQVDGSPDFARVLDIGPMLQAAFVPRARPERRGIGVHGEQTSSERAPPVERLVTFDVGGQAYALPLAAVQEIIPRPPQGVAAPGADQVLLGVVAYRGRALPLVSLHALLGFSGEASGGDSEKVLVTHVGGGLVGLVADQVRSVVSAPAAAIDPAPAMLAARIGGEAKVAAIYRTEAGRRLVSILDPATLFREDVMAKLTRAAGVTEPRDRREEAEQRQFVVFRLGDEEFGLPIGCVDEVARMPPKIARVPRTPKFLEGVINLRGEVLPVVDQRRRFDMPPSDKPESRRLIVVRTARHRAGVIVDSVSEVLRCLAEQIEEAPDMAGDTSRLVDGVLNLEASARLILLLDPAELLTRAERDLLDAFRPADVQSQDGKDGA